MNRRHPGDAGGRAGGGRCWRLALGLAAAAAGAYGEAAVSLRGDRVSIRADGERLSSVLAEFERLGVCVRMDPDTDRVVRVVLSERKVEQALASLMDPLDSIVSWTVLAGPVGGIPRLEEIRVFAPGRPERARPLGSRPERRELSRGAGGDGPLHIDREVLVVARPGVTAAEFLMFLSRWDASLLESIPAWGVYRIRLPAGADALAAAAEMQRDPRIRAAEANHAIRLPPAAPAEGTGPSAAGSPAIAAAAGAPSVAVFDTGLALPSGWSIALAGAYDATRPGVEVSDPVGHGTQMALIASGAVLPEPAPPTGAAPVLAIRTFDDGGITSNFDLLRAIDYAAEHGAGVLSLSWGTETPSQFLREAVAAAQSRGMAVVAAAGNEPTGRPQYPAAYPGVIAVSAVMPDGTAWEQSNYGEFVVVAAPGLARFPVGYNGPPGRYAGTSTATAYTASLLAQWLVRNPGATPAQAAAALQAAVAGPDASARSERFGYGVLDANAVSRLLPPDPR